MANSRHHKRKKQHKKRSASFYEALPAAKPITPLAPPDVSILQTGTEAALEYGRLIALKSQAVMHEASEVNHQFWVFVDRFAALTRPKLAEYSRALLSAGETAVSYTGAIGADLAAAIAKLRRSFWSRRARSMYVALIAGSALAGAVFVSLAATATLATYGKDIASPAALMSKKKTGTTIVDRTGQILFQGYGAQPAVQVALTDMPQSLKDATLAAEDPQFYDHPGFSWRATARAAWVDITQHGKVEGGSTLTQQLVKNAILTSHKTFQRKYEEVILSMELEKRYSKDQILSMYLNETFYGQGSNGVEAAAQTYFHTSVKNLSLGQSAMLAGLPLGPSRFDPNADPEAATDRRNYVLDRMQQLGKITREQAAVAEAEPLVAYPKTITIHAPHFVFYVLDQLRSQYGEDVIENGGITVKTTLDLGKQNAAQAIVQDQIAKLAGNHVTNGGLVSVEPSTGDIITMVGSVDYNAPGFGAVNVITSQLQPGSSFKPIAYLTAFEKGWNGSTQVDDAPISLPNGDGTQYVPQNYDLKFRGKVTLRRALSNSLNIPAIKVIQYAGIPDTIKTAHALGITGLNEPSQYGVSLVLGSGNVKPIDMATVYATLANNGTKVAPRAVLSVADRYDKDITKKTQPPAQKAVDPRYAYMITSILSDNAARTEEFGANSPLKLNRPAAAKTGTTNDFRDNWTVGYTPNLATAVWVGNNDHSAMTGIDGITGAAPIWHNYMEMALTGVPVQNFTPPAGLTTAKVCSADGGLANPWDSGYDEIFLSDQPLTRHCSSTGGNFFNHFFNNPAEPSPTPAIPVTAQPVILLQPPHGKQLNPETN